MDGWELIDIWWDVYNPQPADPKEVESGKRAPLKGSKYVTYPGGVKQRVTDGNVQTGACQYWISGLAPVCELWDGASSTCTFDVQGEKPSGYGVGRCDMLGRRDWCTHYKKSKDYDPNEFVCVLPCVERSGMGRQIKEEMSLSFVAIMPEEIQGYNPDDNNVGQCDGLGMGRGGEHGLLTDLVEAWKYPTVCRFFRPQLMGFGAYQPRPYHGSTVPGLPFDSKRNWVPRTLEELHDGSPADPLTYMDPRMPFAFQVYNNRAMYQKCAHWKSNRPAFFTIGSWGDNPHDFTIDLDEDPKGLCGCKDSGCNPYKNVIKDWDPLLPPMLEYVWADYGGVVCNGAKPECPCYSGQWIYCTDANMKDGMRISAEQIMELRFWASNWASKEEYDEFYQKKPGPTQTGYADETTSIIYTFKEWEMIDNKDPNKSIMIGTKVDLCMPAPIHMREFIPEEYLIKERMRYPNMEGYTGTNILGQGVLFPTLVRELEPPPDFIPDLFIMYPYYNKNVWDKPVCGKQEDITSCIHDFNLMQSKPYISVIGHGPKESEVYVLNANIVENMLAARGFMDQYQRANKVPFNMWKVYVEACQAAIDGAEKQGAGMSIGITTTAGFFHLDDVELELNKVNYLYVLCKYTDFLQTDGSSAFTFRKITVESRFWGALITQNSAIHSPSGDVWDNPFPKYYGQNLFLNGMVHNTQGKVQEVMPANFLYVASIVGNDTKYYSYCINRRQETVEDVEKWAQVGPTGYIWAEIDNIDINYLFDFSIIEATMTYTAPADKDGNRVIVSMCGQDPDDEVKLQVVYPSGTMNYNSGMAGKPLDRRTIPPNAVLLKAPQPLPFFNSKWKLSITYTYDTFDDTPSQDEWGPDYDRSYNPVWPVGMDGGYFSMNKYAPSPFRVQHASGDTSFTIPSIGGLTNKATAKVMAFIVDENERVQVAASTKLLTQGQQLKCRNVDIFYSYRSDATAYDLEPSTGFFTWTGTPSVNESTSAGRRHGRTAMCGDHLCGGLCPPGFSWFPFNACAQPDFYNVLNGAAQCTMRISEGDEVVASMGPGGVRYGVANEYEAWVTLGGNSASACGTSFYYHYSQAPMSSMQFSGKGYKKTKVDKWYYILRDWALPPFGNTGRGSVERYLVRDFSSHIDFSGPKQTVSFRHMPHIVDTEDLVNQTLNCFETPDAYSLAGDPFSCFPMLSNYVFQELDEVIGSERLRWKEIVQVIYHGNCAYPWPVRRLGGVQRYGFLNDSHIWLWPEYWKPIERNKSSTNGEFKFITVRSQDYFFDYFKEEHRFCPAEGQHTLVFEPPTEADETGEGDTETKAYPSISLDGAFPRFFQIVYDDYDSQMVDWKDETNSGEEGSSGGEDESSGDEQIYEKTCINKNQGITSGKPDGDEEPAWIHNYDTIFEGSASVDPSEERKACTGLSLLDGLIYGYYNRGLIADIPRNKLYFLPMAESDAGGPASSYEDPERAREIHTWELGMFGVAPTKIVVVGDWGVDKSAGEGKEVVYSKAGISVRENTDAVEFEEGGSPKWSNGDFVGSVSPAYGSTQKSISRYTVTLELIRSPKRFTQNLNHFMISITAYGFESLKIHQIYAYTGQYIRAEEQIMVWERMFHPGIAEMPDDAFNADGTKTKTVRDYHRDRVNAGQYFPFNEKLEVQDPELEGSGYVVSKTNMVGVTEVFTEDEELSITMDNLKQIELEAQEELYLEAFDKDDYDELNFAGIRPPAIRQWLETVNAHISQASSMKLTHYKTPWEKHPAKYALNQKGTFWQPGGHYFKWSDNFIKTLCYVFGPVQEVYSPLWVHHIHGGVGSTLTAFQSYAGWGRLWYYEGKLANMMSVGMDPQYNRTDALTGAKNQVYKESR
jgi:hypothetical protein